MGRGGGGEEIARAAAQAESRSRMEMPAAPRGAGMDKGDSSCMDASWNTSAPDFG